MIPPHGALWWKIGAISGALAVGLGAFGAHGLQKKVKDPKMLQNWNTAAHYHLVHSLAIMLVPFARRNMGLAGTLLTAGVTVFSGSLYAMVLTDQRKLGAVTPIGGVAMIGGWLALALACV
eukprot:TRINITY_DN1059_c0_g1_i1.p2 TRINITY_DN1059_c0_g1~~TRINITY_DN1059_c0_g1_i1.p2  ORF type:complete len:140 (-),score=44.88 TRINITY_DN1059_c0_g1_i1:48-410(-)